MGKIIYSYHTFIMPFWLEENQHIQNRVKYICQQLELRKCWEKLNYSEIKQKELNYINQDYRILYDENMYFHPYVQKAIYGDKDNIVTNYVFKLEKDEKMTYRICKEETYELEVNSIQLKIYNTGVVLFSIKCKNTRYEDWKSIKAINEYGRRRMIPFMPKKDEKDKAICADKIEIEYQKKDETKIKFISDFKQQIQDFYNATGETNINKYIAENRVGRHILELLNYSEANVEESKIHKFTVSQICPLLDDRMYVMCVVNKKASLQEDALYEFVFIDTENGVSCPTKDMQKKLLEEHTYRRWEKYGTIYGMTSYSFVACTDFKPNINTFLNMYYQICCLVLAQRASILSFKNESMELSKGIENCKSGIKISRINWLMLLQERYVAYQNQLNFFEVSSQEQAIDLYELLRKVSMIEKENEVMKEQLQSLYNAANVNLDYGINIGGFIFAIIALALSIPSYFGDGCGIKIAQGNGILMGIVLIVLGIGAVLTLFLKRRFFMISTLFRKK